MYNLNDPKNINMKNISKNIVVISGIFLLSVLLNTNADARVTLCNSNGCLDIDKISFDKGVTWEDACCSHFQNQPGTCTDDCEDIALGDPGSDTEIILYEGSGIEFEQIENGETVKYTFEFKANTLKLQEHSFEAKEGITNVLIEIPNTGSYINLINGKFEKPTNFTKLLEKVFPPVKPTLEVNCYPNPIATKESIQINANQTVKRIELFNLSGEKMSEENFDSSIKVKTALYEHNIQTPGVYLLRITPNKSYIEPRTMKIVIVD